MNKSKKLYYCTALLILCLGIGLRFVGLDKGIWTDEYASINRATGDDYIKALRNDMQPPTYFLILRLWAKINDSEVFFRILSIIFGMLSIVVVMLWLKHYSLLTSLIGGFIFTTTPILLRYSQEIRGYSLLILATVFSLYSITQIVFKEKNRWYIYLSLALCIAATTHITGILVLPTVGIYLLVHLLDNKKEFPWGKIILAFLPPVLLYFIIYFFFFENLYSPNWWMPPLSMSLFKSQFRYVFGVDKFLFPTRSLRNYRLNSTLLYEYGLKIAVFLLGSAILILGNWRKSWHLLLTAVVYWSQVILISLLFRPIFWFRTLIIGVVLFIGFVAIQSNTIRFNKLRIFVMISICLLSLLGAIGWIEIEAGVPQEQWRQAAHYIEEEFLPSDVIAFYPPYTEGPIRYYFRDLDDDNVIKIPLEMNIEELAEGLEAQMTSLNNPNAPQRLFLIVRRDRSVELKQGQFNEIKDYLISIANNQYPDKNFGIIFIFRYAFD